MVPCLFFFLCSYILVLIVFVFVPVVLSNNVYRVSYNLSLLTTGQEQRQPKLSTAAGFVRRLHDLAGGSVGLMKFFLFVEIN